MWVALLFAATVAGALLGALGRLGPVHEGLVAACGALAALLLGFATWRDLGSVVALTWDATLSLVAIMVLSRILDDAGLFRWAALHALRAARGDGRRAFILIIAISAATSALFTNDGTVLILTPIAAEMLAAAGLGGAAMVPYLVANGFIADAFSTPLPSSNLVNILAADFVHVPATRYATAVLPASLAALGAASAALHLLYGRALPRELPREPAAAAGAVRDWPTVAAGLATLPLIAAAFLVTAARPIPVFAVLGPAAALVAALHAARHGWRAAARQALRAPWRVIVFATGMNVVVFALRDAGGVAALAGPLAHAPAAAWAAAAAVGASVANNLPSTLFDLLLLQRAGGGLPHALALVLGNDIGPKLTPIGSLATLIWFDALRRRGVAVPWREYLRSGWILTPVALGAAVAVLAVTVR
jgi:arsenical pump membrane protein